MNLTNVPLNESVAANDSELVNEGTLYNETINLDEELFPNWLIHTFFGAEVCGVLIHALVILIIMHCKRNGTLCLVLQMSLVDLLTIYVAIIEVITTSQHNWFFSTIHCQVHKGLEIFVNTLSSYLIICLNFHIVSLWNMNRCNITNKKNPLTSNIEESDECLVTRNDTPNRIVNIDYRRKKNDVSIVIPSLTIWFLCISLSLPIFTLASTSKNVNGHILCDVTPLLNAKALQGLMITFRIFIPVTLILITFGLVIYKFYQTLRRDFDDVITKKFDELRVVLICCLILSLSYTITSFQRYYFQLNYLLSNLSMDNNILQWSYNFELDLYLCILHYSGTVFRSIIYLYMLPKSWKMIKDKIFSCKSSE